jgi:hypothetical protein
MAAVGRHNKAFRSWPEKHLQLSLIRLILNLVYTFLCPVSLSQLEYIGAACAVTLSNIVAETSK